MLGVTCNMYRFQTDLYFFVLWTLPVVFAFWWKCSFDKRYFLISRVAMRSLQSHGGIEHLPFESWLGVFFPLG